MLDLPVTRALLLASDFVWRKGFKSSVTQKGFFLITQLDADSNLQTRKYCVPTCTFVLMLDTDANNGFNQIGQANQEKQNFHFLHTDLETLETGGLEESQS